MSSTIDTREEVTEYLATVRANLVDLSDGERDDLLAEVEASLVETAADAGSIEGRLGPPDAFARELRAAAGLEEPPKAATPRRPRRLARGLLHRVRSARYDDLLPVWWVVRAYVVIAGVGVVFGSWSFRHPAVPRIGNGPVTVALLAAAVVASFVIGRREGRHRVPAALVNFVLAVVAVPILWHAATARHVEFVVTPPPELPSGLLYGGLPVDNIYPYSAKGQLLHDVLLYDGRGRPITIGAQFTDPNRRVLRSKSGKPMPNAYPIRYFEPGTRTIARPNAAPARLP